MVGDDYFGGGAGRAAELSCTDILGIDGFSRKDQGENDCDVTKLINVQMHTVKFGEPTWTCQSMAPSHQRDRPTVLGRARRGQRLVCLQGLSVQHCSSLTGLMMTFGYVVLCSVRMSYAQMLSSRPEVTLSVAS